MEAVYFLVLLILVVATVMSLVRAALGPTVLDRMLATNAFTTKTVLIICVYLFSNDHPEFIDIALLYALIAYVGSIALVQYFKREWGDRDG